MKFSGEQNNQIRFKKIMKKRKQLTKRCKKDYNPLYRLAWIIFFFKKFFENKLKTIDYNLLKSIILGIYCLKCSLYNHFSIDYNRLFCYFIVTDNENPV